MDKNGICIEYGVNAMSITRIIKENKKLINLNTKISYWKLNRDVSIKR